MTDTTTLCATIVPGDADGQKGNKIMERIVSSCYEACRSQQRDLEGFPDFKPLLAELKSMSATGGGAEACDTFAVTTCVPSGALVIRNQFFEQFKELPEFDSLVEDHNKKFNKDNLTLSDPEVPGSSTDDAKKQRKTEVMATDEPIKPETVSSLANPSGPQAI